MTAAETLLFANDPGGALDALLVADVPRNDPRRIRLELDAFVAQGTVRLAEERALKLQALPGWGAHGRQQMTQIAAAGTKRLVVRIGLILFAMCLAALSLAASRELLRVGRETLGFLVFALGAVVVIRTGSGPLAALVALPSAASLALVHAAAATVRRTASAVRGRTLTVALVLLGAVGAFGAVGAEIGSRQILALLAG